MRSIKASTSGCSSGRQRASMSARPLGRAVTMRPRIAAPAGVSSSFPFAFFSAMPRSHSACSGLRGGPDVRRWLAGDGLLDAGLF
jgi:hypothetical protein